MFDDGGDEHVGSQQELCVCYLVDVGIGVEWELEEEWPPYGAQSSLGHELLVHVFEEGVA